MRLAFLLLLLPLASCADDEPAPTTLRTGVNDVRAACELRAAWTKPLSPDCTVCTTAVLLPPCSCELVRDFGAACYDQAVARRAEPSCTDAVDKCVDACPRDGCGCIEGCYAQAAACRAATAARDGCVAEVCARYCQ